MKSSNLTFENKWYITEKEYSLETEPNVAALFTTGNGYAGIRGSLEEFGSIRIQGAYIRGVIDRIYELVQPFLDNEYMKNHYFDEQKLKHFEKQESIVNFADILLIRISVDNETFYPWKGRILSWKRTLDIKNCSLKREVRWENSKGQVTTFCFERFSSFDNDHIYCQKVTIDPENHSAEISVLSGIDTVTKTNGQLICKPKSKQANKNTVVYENVSGEHYSFDLATAVCSFMYDENGVMPQSFIEYDDGDLLASKITFLSETGKAYTLEKKIYFTSSRDTAGNVKEKAEKEIGKLQAERYDSLFEKHIKAWSKFFENIDIQIDGDDNADMSLRFSNYHTAISLARNDSVHSLSAKGLTGEIYNNFVWWDCEVYQAPVFFQTVPEAAKNILIYRYNKLNAARENAKREGRRGARFPFTSSVTGEETVWAYARHPFLQIHIVADIAWGVCNYYLCTGDGDFMTEYGLEILWEVSRYWADRVEKDGNRYVINNVTGTDEHHPYVDNNAYTNYEVAYILKRAAELYVQFGNKTPAAKKIRLTDTEVDYWNEISHNIYLPLDQKTGMIPQFDGYFSLNRNLEISGGATAKSFQMKQSGLYHKSQVIKQPDVLLLFSYLNMRFDKNIYHRNWDYYEARCESASSLSYSVHSICASDMGEPESAYQYFLKTARLDLDDEHNCAWQGIHSACAAGAWLAVVRGVAGVIFHNDYIELQPNMIPWWDKVNFNVVWHGQKLNIILDMQKITISSSPENTSRVTLKCNGSNLTLDVSKAIDIDVSIREKTGFEFV